MELHGNTSAKSGTKIDSSANIAAFADHPLTMFDLALMPDYRRKARLRHMGADAPTEADIAAAWREMHAVSNGKRVYFIVRGVGDDAPIKIGLARNPKRRMSALQTASAERLVLMATCPGDRALEQEYHRQFSEHRLEGEWFRPAPAIMQEIRRIWASAKYLGRRAQTGIGAARPCLCAIGGGA